MLALLPLLPALFTGGFAVLNNWMTAKTAAAQSGANAVQARDTSSPIAAVIDALAIEPLAIAVSLYYAKIFFVDKLLALGTTTDPLSPELHTVAMAVLSLYTFKKLA